MSSKDRLDRLNAYLISKGRKPKSAAPVNFVKQNIVVARNNPTTATNINWKRSVKAEALSNSTNNLRKNWSRSSMAVSNKVRSMKKSGEALKRSNSPSVSVNSPHIRITAKSRERVHSEKKENSANMRKKLVRRSIHTLAKKNCKTINKSTPKSSKFNSQSQAVKKSATPASHINRPIRQKLIKEAGSKSVGSTPLQKSNSRLKAIGVEKDGDHYKKLNSWLLLKGKKPFGISQNYPKGFKAIKAIQTPSGSPMPVADSPLCRTPTGKSHWQGLRDEDELDEIAVLVRNIMGDVKNCINEGCPTSVLQSTLEELSSNLAIVKRHASYWMTLALIEQAAGSEYEKICDIYEKAILAKAQPINEIQEGLNNWLLNRVTEKESNGSLDKPNSSNGSVPTNQATMSHPTLQKIKMAAASPVYKNAATSPIVFESPVTNGNTSKTCSQSPSSVVKLRMISKSSPVFNRLKSRKTVPESASAIITPVRRSTRIATAQLSYPKSLRDHEPCLSSVQEIFPALGCDYDDLKLNSMSCNVVFDPNSALDDGDTDIAKVLKF